MKTILFVLLCLLFQHQAVFADELSGRIPIKIGVLDTESQGGWDYNWDETIDYLNETHSNYFFDSVHMSWGRLANAIENREVDFVISSPVFKVVSASTGNISIMATLRRDSEEYDAFNNLYGSVIFWKADNQSIKSSLNVIDGKRIAAGPPMSLGGWLAAKREFAERGFLLTKYSSEIVHHKDVRKIVQAVLNGDADFGITRTSSLELLIEEGVTDQNSLAYSRDLYFNTERMSFACSTRLYPEWAFSKVAHTPSELAESVGISLLQMPRSNIPGGISWGISANYLHVHELMRTLRMEPYRYDDGLMIFFKRWLSAFIAVFATLTFIIVYLLHLNRKLRFLSTAVEGQKYFLQHLVDSIPDIVFVKDSKHRFLLCNQAFKKAFKVDPVIAEGKTEESLFEGEKIINDSEDEQFNKTGLAKHTQTIRKADQSVMIGEIIKVKCYLNKDREERTLSIIRDVTSSFNAMKLQQQREKLIASIATATHYLVGADVDIDKKMPIALRELSAATDAERVGLIKLNDNLSDLQEHEYICCCYYGQDNCDVRSAKIISEIINSNKARLTSDNRLEKVLHQHTDAVKSRLLELGVKSLLLLPVFVNDKLWGCLEIQNHKHERKWYDFEISALELAAEVFGSMIERSDDFKRLVDYKDRLSLALQSTGMFLWEYDFVDNVNRTADDLYVSLGYIEDKDIEDARQLGFDIIHPDDVMKLSNISQSEICTFEARLRNSAGRYVWHSFLGRNYYTAKEKHLKIIGFFRDTSFERERDMALRIEEGRNIHALTAAKAASWEYVPEEKRFYWSRHIKNLLGYNPDIFSPNIQSIYQVIHPDDLSYVRKTIRKFLVSGTELRFECRIRKNEGTYSWFANIGTRVRDPELPGMRYYGILLDISETKVLQQNLLEARNKAEKMAEEAQRANVLKSEFLANMSHEIRTPMNGILGMLQLLVKTKLDSKQKDYAQLTYRSAQSLMQILDSVLDISKIEAGKFSIEPFKVNLKAIVEDVVRLMSPIAQNKKIELGLDYAEDIPEIVVADGVRVKQILNNLVSNSLKFTEYGFVKITISAEKTANSELWKYKFAVRDTGIGMTEEQKMLALEKFTQADSSITRRFGGTGLGLTICRELIKLMNGELFIESSKGFGTNVFFYLNLPKASGPLEEKYLDLLDDKTDFNMCVNKELRILVVEDNQINQEVTKGMLLEIDCSVTVVDSGEEALNAISKEKYDVILLDCQMPNMDGFEVVRRIRAMDSDVAQIPVIAITAHSMPGDDKKCFDAGMDGYLPKPFTIEQLTHAICELVECNLKNNDEQEIIDESRLKRIFKNNPAALQKITDIIGGNFEKLIKQADAGVAEQNWQSVRDALHSIRGSVANLGGIELEEIILEMHTAAKQKDIGQYKELRNDVENCYDRFYQRLKNTMEQIKNAAH